MEELNDIENIVLFVGDAVRYDSAESKLRELGPTIKTIASSLHTPASFGSILTGLNVTSHGVIGFQNVLPDNVPSLLDLERWNTAFSHKTGTMHKDMHRIFRTEDRSSLSDLETPFVWVVRDPGGHAPYAGYDGDTYDQLAEDAMEYFQRVAGDTQTLRKEYQAGVDQSISRFRKAIESIENRGLSDSTLLIYTSDHGELLGEYGFLGHNHVACPELVYVPTTFVHPSLKAGGNSPTLRHVDLAPTIYDHLDVNLSISLDGASLMTQTDRIGYNHFEMTFYNSDYLRSVSSEVSSCWGADGGHAFVKSRYRDALTIYAGLLASSQKGKHMLKSGTLVEPLKKLLPGHQIYGDPPISKEDAELFVQDVKRRDVKSLETELTSETQERLNDLGYI